MRKSALLILSIAVLLLSITAGCSILGPSSPQEPIFTTYINDQFDYSISYPENWLEGEQSKKEVYILASDPDQAYICIAVLENATLPMSEIAKRWLVAVTQSQDNVAIIDSAKMEGLWDWYLSYDYVSKWDEDFHAEVFFKQVGTRVYRVDLIGERAKYSDYPFSEILASFKLSTEQNTQ